MSTDFTARLMEAGLSPVESARKAALLETALQTLRALPDCTPTVFWRWFVPGRIEVLGKHTDYAGGRSLLCAVERGFCVVAARRTDQVVRVVDAARGLHAEFSLTADCAAQVTGWHLYPHTVLQRIARNFPGDLRGVDFAFASDLPDSAGLSSSSAFMVAVFAALNMANGLAQRPEYSKNIRGPHELAGYLGSIENGQTFGTLEGDRGVGTFGGSEDHTAILSCRAGQLSQFSFCPVREERCVALPHGAIFVIGTSGVAAGKTGAAREPYNRAALTAKTILQLWREASGRNDESLFAAVTHSSDAPQRIRQVLRHCSTAQFTSQKLMDRLDQFVGEVQHIIPGAVQALESGNLAAFGEWVAQSQANAERLLGNQIPETVELVRSARRLGALAASAFGAGFGGSVWALARSEQAEEFRCAWEKDYRDQFPSRAKASEFFVSGAGPALLQL